jgi:DNA polymerase III subunit gamma/tau
VLVRFLAASLSGAAGCEDPLEGAEGGVVGGGTVPLPPPLEPADASIADEEPAPELEPAAPAPPAAPDDSSPAAPAAAPTALTPREPTAIAPPATNAPVETRSPPDSAGEPPRTAAKSLEFASTAS